MCVQLSKTDFTLPLGGTWDRPQLRLSALASLLSLTTATLKVILWETELSPTPAPP